jgi:hypothetical protein
MTLLVRQLQQHKDKTPVVLALLEHLEQYAFTKGKDVFAQVADAFGSVVCHASSALISRSVRLLCVSYLRPGIGKTENASHESSTSPDVSSHFDSRPNGDVHRQINSSFIDARSNGTFFVYE